MAKIMLTESRKANKKRDKENMVTASCKLRREDAAICVIMRIQ